MAGKGPRVKPRSLTTCEETASFRSDDLEVLELNMPAAYGTFDLAGPGDGAAGA